MSIRENRVLILILVLTLVIRILFVFSSPLKIWDETVYANLGYDLNKNPFDYSFADKGWSDFIPCKDDLNYCWPKAGFRAPLLPYTIAVFYFLKLDFLISFLMPFIGTLSVLLVYILGKKLFNKTVGIYSALFLALIPLHVYYSAKILTDAFVTFFITLTFISFWKGYEENNSKYKILFGFFLALALLARYTVLWIIPVFLIYFLITSRLKFLKDKYLWYAILIFFVILIPWFIFGFSEYGSPLGAFIHGLRASSYWGGTQSWHFFFQYWWIFSVIGIISVFSLLYVICKKKFLRKEIYLLLIWIFFFLIIAILMPHKEDRFILPIAPAICLLSAFFINEIKIHRKLILFIIILILVFSLYLYFSDNYQKSYTDSNTCFLEGNLFLNDNKENAVVITDESPLIYFYSKKETHFYPGPWSIQSLRNLVDNNYRNKEVFILFSDFDMPLNDAEHIQIKKDLDSNYEKLFECSKQNGFTIIYQYS